MSLASRVVDQVRVMLPALIMRHASAAARARLTLRGSALCVDVIDERERRLIRLNRTNLVYVLDMINHFDYYFGASEPVRVWRGARAYDMVDFSSPRYHVVRGFADFPVMCPSLTEPYVTTEQYLDFACLGPGHVVLDLGSYSGLTSIAFSKAVGEQGRVVALEPDAGNMIAARINVARHERINGLRNITLVPAAAGPGRGTMVFSAEGAMGSAAVDIVGGGRGSTIEVPTLGLQDIADEHRLGRVDFVKMDIEGSEEAVIAGAADFLRRFRPRLIIEVHPVNGEMSDRRVRPLLEACGYRCQMISQTGVDVPLLTAVMAAEAGVAPEHPDPWTQ